VIKVGAKGSEKQVTLRISRDAKTNAWVLIWDKSKASLSCLRSLPPSPDVCSLIWLSSFSARLQSNKFVAVTGSFLLPGVSAGNFLKRDAMKKKFEKDKTRCFSVVSAARSLDLVCLTVPDYDDLTTVLGGLMRPMTPALSLRPVGVAAGAGAGAGPHAMAAGAVSAGAAAAGGIYGPQVPPGRPSVLAPTTPLSQASASYSQSQSQSQFASPPASPMALSQPATPSAAGGGGYAEPATPDPQQYAQPAAAEYAPQQLQQQQQPLPVAAAAPATGQFAPGAPSLPPRGAGAGAPRPVGLQPLQEYPTAAAPSQ
jgi:hypothetical protein